MNEPQVENLLIHRVKLVSLIAIFLLPFIAGWLAFYVFEYRPGTKNYGELVNPARPLELPQLTTLDRQVLDRGYWNKWTFVLLDKQGCPELCRSNLHYLRQMIIALGRDMDRVQSLFATGQPLSPELAEFLAEFPDLSVVTTAPSALFELFELPGKPAGEVPRLYLVDPAGNLMMTYPASNDPGSILSDLRRLLKVSQIG